VRSSEITFGLALPPVAFMTWPTRKPTMLVLPALYLAMESGLSARDLVDRSRDPFVSVTCFRPRWSMSSLGEPPFSSSSGKRCLAILTEMVLSSMSRTSSLRGGVAGPGPGLARLDVGRWRGGRGNRSSLIGLLHPGNRIAPGLARGDEEHLRWPAVLERPRVERLALAREDVPSRSAEECAVPVQLGHRRGGLLRIADGRAAALVFDEIASPARSIVQHGVRLQSAALYSGPISSEVVEWQIEVLAENPAESPRHFRRSLSVLRHEAEEDLVQHHLVLQEGRADIVLRRPCQLQIQEVRPDFETFRRQSPNRRPSHTRLRTRGLLVAPLPGRPCSRRRCCAPHSRAPA